MPDNIEEKLDSPLVVHKESDSSYQEAASEITMSSTHTDDEDSETPTLERHRFRKDRNKSSHPLLIIAVIIVIAAVVGGLIYTDKLPFGKEETTEETTIKSYTEKQENEFEGTIVIKGTYIFFEGEEIDGIQELERNIKYLDEGTSFVIKDEHADSDFLNNEVLLLLSQYGIKYEITHVESSGLMAANETTTAASATTTTTAPSITSAE